MGPLPLTPVSGGSTQGCGVVQFIGVSDAVQLVRSVGTGAFMAGLVEHTREDCARRDRFESSARLASHSPTGVIEPMPTSDGRLHSLAVTAFGMLPGARQRAVRAEASPA